MWAEHVAVITLQGIKVRGVYDYEWVDLFNYCVKMESRNEKLYEKKAREEMKSCCRK